MTSTLPAEPEGPRTLHHLAGALAHAAHAQPGPARSVADDAALTQLTAVSDAVFPWHTGGKEVRQHELWQRLADRGVQVDVYTMRWWDQGDSVTRDGITYHALCRAVPLYSGERRSIRQALLFAVGILRMLRVPLGAVEVDALPFLHVLPVWVVARLKRARLLATWHEYWGLRYWQQYLGPCRGALAALIEYWASGLADTIVAASELTAQRLRHRRPRARIVVVENGVDATALAAAAEARTCETTTLVVIGRLLRHKNVDVAIRALRVLVDRWASSGTTGEGRAAVRLEVIGVGPDEPRLRALVSSLGLSDRVTFVAGVETHVELLRRIAAARLVLFPSSREGFGMVAAEAISLRTPVITSDCADNAARLLLRDDTDGLAVPPSPQEFAAAVEATWGLKARAQHAETGDRWDWEHATDQVRTLLLAAQPDAPRSAR